MQGKVYNTSLTEKMSHIVCCACSKEKEITGLQQTIEEDQTTIASLQRRIRELEAKIEELEEDLENERSMRKRVWC